MDLSNSFDCINNDLLIEKLVAYVLGGNAVKLIKSYLAKRKQRAKINGSNSTYRDITVGYLKGQF